MIQVVRIVFLSLFILIFYNHSTAQVRFCAVGDVLLDRGVRRIIDENDVFFPFENVKDIISSNDIAFYNNEFPLADISDGYAINKRFSFRADTAFVDGLKYAGFNIASVANNHTIDYGKSGLLKTMEVLNKNSIFTIGAGKNQQEAFEPLLIEKNGETFAFFANLEFLLEGTTFNQNKPYPAFAQIDRLCKQIEKYNSIVDFVIVSFHWGKEDLIIPTSKQIEYAHKVVDAGADLIIGHHPHVLQSIEIYRNKIILYSLGNFVFDNSHKLEKQSVIFQCEFKNGEIIAPELIPISIKNNRPEIAPKNETSEIFEHLKKASSFYNTYLWLNNKKISIKYSFKKTVKELRFNNLKFDFYKDNLTVFDDKFYNFTYKLPDTNYIFKDACLYQQNDTIYLYTIVTNKKNQKSQIAIFPYSIENMEFLKPSIDVHDNYNPWKIDLLDVDEDGKTELILGVFKSTRYYKDVENRVFVFNRDKSYIYPKWLGSKIGNTLIDFKIEDDKLIILEKSNNKEYVNSYVCKWNGFGFDIKTYLFKLNIKDDIKFNFHLKEYNFINL